MTRLATLRGRARGEGGQALVEFALILPFLLVLIIGIVEFGRAWNIKQVITDAAREGARRSVIADASITQADVENVIKTALAAGGVDPDKGTKITIAGRDFSKAPDTGLPVTVAIEVPFNFVFFGPMYKLFTGGGTTQTSFNLSTSFTMRSE